MVGLFITDSRQKYDENKYAEKLLYLDGFIKACSFIGEDELETFNGSIVGIEDEAYRLMLVQFDHDVKLIIDNKYTFSANRFIKSLAEERKVNSLLFNFHKHFIFRKYLFQLVVDRFLAYLSSTPVPLSLYLSESFILTQELPFDFKSIEYYSEFKNEYPKYLVRLAFQSLRVLINKKTNHKKTQVAIFLFDIPNEFDVIKKFIELVKKDNKIHVTLVVIDSGNPSDKKVDISPYEGENVKVISVYTDKAVLYTDYSAFYAVCQKINPLYSIFKKSRLCEKEDIQYAFINNVIQKISLIFVCI